MFDDEERFIIGESADRPIGYPPKNTFIRQALEKLYISILGALDLGDFDTFLKESKDLNFEEAKDKMIREYGTPTELSKAVLRAKSSEAASKLEIAELEAASEQRTLESEFAELDEIARKRLGDNLDLTRRNENLETELKRLKEELATAKGAPLIPKPLEMPIPILIPAAAPIRITPAPLAAHGSMYNEYKKLISQVLTIANINDLANEIFEILEREEFSKLTRQDIEEMREDLRKASQSRAIKLAEMRVTGPPKIGKIPISKKEEELPVRKREKREVPSYPIPSGIPQISYKYNTPDTETFVSMGEPFIRDFELERTIKLNSLLIFPAHWYTLSPWGKREVYGWDMGMAFREAVQHLHKYSWQILIKDYGIPEAYIAAWQQK